jgi:glutathione S-transferase
VICAGWAKRRTLKFDSRRSRAAAPCPRSRAGYPDKRVRTARKRVPSRTLPCGKFVSGSDVVTLKLIIGNKNYSSWSFRPWLAMKVADIAFEEELVSLDAADFKARLGAVSAAGKVPVLVDDDICIWESLAILEYVAEKFPAARLWPVPAAARAHARAIAAEMHAGFSPLRRHLPMNMRRPVLARELDARVLQNVARIEAIWADCRRRFASSGPFLYGAFTAADAMYAPVVSRFHTYDVGVGEEACAYMRTIMTLPAWQEWEAAARNETGVLAEDEVDWPFVLGL